MTMKWGRRIRAALMSGVVLSSASPLRADPLLCDLTEYRAQPGLTASASRDALTIQWEGDRDSELRIRFAILGGTPTIRELAGRPANGEWRVLATDVTPEFRVVSGVRRVTQQQLRPLQGLGVPLTEAVLDEIKWDAFWDAPLFIEGSGDPPLSHGTSIPPAEPFANHPGLPRRPEEVVRATATYHARSCAVTTNGARLEITFPGVEAGIFAGRLQYDLYKGSGLIRQMLVATTDHPSAAFKFDAGLVGLPIAPRSRVVWRDLANQWQDYRFGGPVSLGPATVRSSNRLVVAEVPGGSIAAFPPPHTFYWARESEQNLGYSWYRKDSATSFSFGVRQAEREDDPYFYQNFALYSARPGTWQRMPVFFYVSTEPAAPALESSLAFTRGDRFRPLPGYKVMGAHYHVGIVQRLRDSGSLDTRLNDIDAAKAVGIDIYGIIDGPRFGPFDGPRRDDRGLRGEERLQALADYYEATRRHSDENFLIMPNTEYPGIDLGGHSDLLVSRPVFWLPERAEGQPFVEQHPRFGTVYNVGNPAELMEFARLENLLLSIAHPRSKGSTGFPEAVKDSAHFLHENFHGAGFRWGMGIDASETRLCEYRCLALWDEMNNWVADLPVPLKQMTAISEARSDIGDRGKPPYDDTYGMSPVNYVRLDRLPEFDDMSPIIEALRRGDYFMTSGEVLITDYAVEGTGDHRTIVAEIEWTFPLDFVEVVWGDGRTTDRQIISAAHLPAFGQHRFEIPFDAAGKKWMRFAAWDVATNGALVQPIRLTDPQHAGPP